MLAAFLAGIVALFAPCCISYLFPAYLGSIFKEKKKILLMTFIYSLGIFTVMMPIVLGASILSTVFMRFHETTYIIGGSLMILVSFITLLGLKMPMPHLGFKQKKTPDIISTYTLGIMSGVTSACCAPVLIGVMTLSSLTFSVMSSIAVGFSFVLGMVSPLYLASLIVEKVNILEKPILKKKLKEIKIGKTTYPIFISNVIGFVTFFLTGILIMTLSLLGKLSMGEEELIVAKQLNNVAYTISEITDKYPLLNLLFIIAILFLIYFIGRKIKSEVNSSNHKEKDCCKQS